MRAYFSDNVGRRHVFVLHGLGGAGKSQISFKFVEECQVDAEPSRYAAYVRQIHILATDAFHSALSKVSEVLFVDASTIETITADLRSIAVTKGIGDSENDTLN